MTQDQNILKLLEEGDSAAIRLGHQLLSAVEHPEDPALALWKKTLRMVEDAGELSLFIHHAGKIGAVDSMAFHRRLEESKSGKALLWPNLDAVFEMLASSCGQGRLHRMVGMRGLAILVEATTKQIVEHELNRFYENQS